MPVNCFPESATHHDAVRICRAVGAHLCDEEGVRRCCGMGCERSDVAWLLSPRSAQDMAWLPDHSMQQPVIGEESASGAQEAEEASETGGQQPELSLQERQAKFLELYEEAKSTVVHWLDAAH